MTAGDQEPLDPSALRRLAAAIVLRATKRGRVNPRVRLWADLAGVDPDRLRGLQGTPARRAGPRYPPIISHIEFPNRKPKIRPGVRLLLPDAGQILAEREKQGPGQYQQRFQPGTVVPPTYSDLGIPKTTAHRWHTACGGGSIRNLM